MHTATTLYHNDNISVCTVYATNVFVFKQRVAAGGMLCDLLPLLGLRWISPNILHDSAGMSSQTPLCSQHRFAWLSDQVCLFCCCKLDVTPLVAFCLTVSLLAGIPERVQKYHYLQQNCSQGRI